MMIDVFMNIPRIYTAIAQWGSCMIFALLFTKKHNVLATGMISFVFLLFQMGFLYYTDGVKLIYWLPIMVASAGLLFLLLKTLCAEENKELLYATICSFMFAETVAAFEWLIHSYFYYILNYTNKILSHGLLIAIYSLFFIGIFFVEKHLLKRESNFYVSRKELFNAFSIVAIIFTLSNLSYIYPDTPFSSSIAYEIFRLRAFIDVLGTVILFFYQLQIKEHIQSMEAVAIKRVLKSQYDKYLSQQQSNEIINMKYHDLKHQIVALRKETDQQRRDEWLDSIVREIDTYKNNINSGNSVLDAIIESKVKDAQKNDINFTYIADGKLLDSIKVADICTIFGNALDNAIESEMKEPEKEKRMIHLSVSAQRKMICISIENYISNPEKIQVSNLRTTKKDNVYHGYGIKSVRYCVEKYHGNMLIKLNGNWFVMSIILPMGEEKKV